MSELAVVRSVGCAPGKEPATITMEWLSGPATAGDFAMLPVSPGSTVTAEKGWWCPAESALMFSTFCDHAGSREVTVVREVV